MSPPLLRIKDVNKTFVLHHQGSTELRVLTAVNLEVQRGECVILSGASGAGKSTLLKLIYANYRSTSGSILLNTGATEPIDMAKADPRALIEARRHHIGYVSQFLRVIPRVSALNVVAEPLIAESHQQPEAIQRALARAKDLLQRLQIPERLWHLPPATFSGGEQQRINIARSLIKPRKLLLLDEPTASLDTINAQTVVALIQEALANGTAAIGIFHDAAVGSQLATRYIDINSFRKHICAAH